MSYQIVTDSASDLPEWIIEKYKVHVIPTPVVINEEDFLDRKTIQPTDFYQILRSGATVTTYHINQYMFYQNLEPYAKAKEEVIYFCFSTGIAGTFNAANLAKQELLEKYPEFDLTVIDSKSASIGFGLSVYLALQMKENGAAKELVIEASRYHFDHMEHIFTVETLEYLYKGGRLSKTAAIAGGILDIKPIIEVTEDGMLSVFEKVRGRQKAIRRMIEIVGERCKISSGQQMALVHADCPDVMKETKELLKERYGCQNFLEASLGCAIGAHTGPGLIGICFLEEESPYKKWFSL